MQAGLNVFQYDGLVGVGIHVAFAGQAYILVRGELCVAQVFRKKEKTEARPHARPRELERTFVLLLRTASPEI